MHLTATCTSKLSHVIFQAKSSTSRWRDVLHRGRGRRRGQWQVWSLLYFSCLYFGIVKPQVILYLVYYHLVKPSQLFIIKGSQLDCNQEFRESDLSGRIQGQKMKKVEITGNIFKITSLILRCTKAIPPQIKSTGLGHNSLINRHTHIFQCRIPQGNSQ